MELDRSSPMPLWAQLEGELKRRLDAGEFVERFPTDSELVQEYAVSRHTVREAIRHLNKTGILRRERGRGTVVDQSEFEQPLGALYSLFESIEASGAEQRSTVVELGETRDDSVAARLGLEPGASLLYLERIRFAAGQPLAIDRAWLPLELTTPLLDSDFGHTALYDELERRCGLRPTQGWERIAPVIPTASDRERLRMRRGEAAFFLERLSHSHGTAIEWRTSTIRGDRYRFLASWSMGAAPALTATTSD
jgi:GntR family transcriptional regulator